MNWDTAGVLCIHFRSECSLNLQQWGAAGAEIKVPSDETHSLKVLPLKPGVGQYIAMHATLTVRDFFHANFYPSGPFVCIFSKTPPEFLLCELWPTPVPA